jgi:hypothetical protein
MVWTSLKRSGSPGGRWYKSRSISGQRDWTTEASRSSPEHPDSPGWCVNPALSPNLLTLWKATFLERAHTLFQPDEQRDEDQTRIAELEQLLGRSTRQIEILKKASTLLDAASTRNGI